MYLSTIKDIKPNCGYLIFKKITIFRKISEKGCKIQRVLKTI